MIGFTAPWALVGLLAAAIPILLHLLSRREPPTVEFPAVRYLSETARAHQRRLTLQHWLLLVLRTLLIVVLVLAAAGPTWPSSGGGAHAPAALVVVLDNSPSSGAVTAGVPLLDRLRAAAGAVLARATQDDALWLITADGQVRRGTPHQLSALVDSLRGSSRRLDLGEAVGLARTVLDGEARPGEVMLLTDLQASALSPAPGTGPVTVARPTDAPPPNAGIGSVDLGSQPWTGGGGRVTVRLAAGDSAGDPLSVSIADRPSRQALAAPERPVAVALPSVPVGWQTVRVELAADEFRADDIWEGAVRVAPPARVRWSPADRFLATACEVLVEGGRIRAGEGVTLGALGPGASIVMPPEDPSAIGALNRALAARGAAWRYGPRLPGAVMTDSGAVVRRHQVGLRHQLVPVRGDSTGVLATAAGAPWAVRSGPIVLLGSRLDPAWTALPTSMEFLPFLDGLINRIAGGEAVVLTAAPGQPVMLPDVVDAVAHAEASLPVEGGAPWAAPAPGRYFLRHGRDTVGLVNVGLDPRESLLARAADSTVAQFWPGSRVVALESAGDVAFTGAGRAALRGPLLWLALLIALAETGLASARRRNR